MVCLSHRQGNYDDGVEWRIAETLLLHRSEIELSSSVQQYFVDVDEFAFHVEVEDVITLLDLFL